MMRLTFKDVSEAGEKAVEAKPHGFRYKDLLLAEEPALATVSTALTVGSPRPVSLLCHYTLLWEDNVLRPGCLVGVILADLGVDTDVLETMDTAVDQVIDEDGVTILESYDIFLTERALAYLKAAQMSQDDLEPWEVAHQAGLAEVGKKHYED